MSHFRAVVAIILLMMILISACAPTTATGKTVEAQFADFDPGNFDNPTIIDNERMPMMPGTKWVQEGTAVEDGENITRRIDFTVTDLTKVIGGVRTVVAWILDYTNGEVIEKELAFYAQDNDGNVWYLGEHPEEYEDGKFVKASPWIAGLEDARAGIKMWAEPKLGGLVVYQGWGPAVGWSDYGQVDQVGQETCVPVDCYKDVLVMAETSLQEANTNTYQLKYYARGVGEIKVGWKGADELKEELVLIDLLTLSPEQMAEVRAEALEVEKHAYEVSKDVYGKTAPLELPDSTSMNIVPTAEAAQPAGVPAAEIVVYASDLPQNALFKLDFIDDAESPEGKSIGLPNNGDELDAPPENDPHVTFTASVQGDIPYRCWIHMKAGTPKGKSQANVIWAQLSNAVDKDDKEVFKPGSSSYLTAQGPTQTGWTWVGCNLEGTDSLIYFQSAGDITVRLQAGAEGVAFDQFVLSSAEYLEEPPSVPVVKKNDSASVNLEE